MGIMEVDLVEAKGLHDADTIFNKMDPYVVLYYKGQEHKSSVARGEGRNPTWNEKFTFRAQFPGSGRDYKLRLKLFDHDTFSRDDYLGQSTIYVEDLLSLGAEKGTAELKPTKYSVVDVHGTYCGEMKVGIKFTAEVRDQQNNEEEEVYGGWKESDFD